MKLSDLLPISRLLSASAILLFPFTLSGQALTGTAEIAEINGSPVIDGQIDEIWSSSLAYPIAIVQSGVVENELDCSADWYGLWDENYLYLLVDITDQTLDALSGTAEWQRDIIEVYFNMDNVRDGSNGHSGDNYQYSFFWDHPNEQHGAYGDWTGIEWAQLQTPNGYRNEIKIPWSSLTTSFAIEQGYSFGFDIAVNDNDGLASYDSVMYWTNSGGALYGNSDGAGNILLGGPFDGNFSPILSVPEVIEVNAGSAASVPISATDANPGDSLSFSEVDFPAFSSLTDNNDKTATLNFNATLSDLGFHQMTVSVSDGNRSDTVTVLVLVRDPNVAFQPPVFEPVADQFVEEGSTGSVDVQVSDLDSLSATIVASSALPDFVILEDAGDMTATLTFSPGYEDEGTYFLNLLATDPDGATGLLTIKLTVTHGIVQTVFYCDPVNGSMANDGTLESPWGSLEALIASGRQFNPGDRIFMLDGYHGKPVITKANDDYVYIQPYQDAAPTLGSIEFKSSSSYWHFSGATISGSLVPGGGALRTTLISIAGSHVTVSDCEAYTVDDISSWSASDWTANAGTGASLGGAHSVLENSIIRNIRWGVFMGGEHTVLRNCRIQNYSGDGVRPQGNYSIVEDCWILDNYKVDDNHDDAIQSYTTPVGSGPPVTGVIIRRNIIMETTDPDRPLQGSLQGIGLFDGFFDDWLIENNAIIVTSYHGIGIYGARRCKVINNTVLDGTRLYTRTWIQIFNHKNGSPSVDNLIRNNVSTDVRMGSTMGIKDHNYEIFPSEFNYTFVDFPNDVRIKRAATTLRDQGTNEEAPIDDQTGAKRLNVANTTVDIGAYEYNEGWNGWPIVDSFVDTGSFLGILEVSNDPWVFAFDLQNWAYVAVPPTSEGGWIYLPK